MNAEKAEQEAAEAFELLMHVLADGGGGPDLRERIVAHCQKWSTRPAPKTIPALEVKDKDGNSLLRVG